MSEWAATKIGELCEDIYDGPHATPKKTENGPIFLGISNLSNGRIDLSDAAHLSEADFERWTRRVTPQPGDVVFSYETRLGEAASIPEGLKCCLGRRMGLLRPDRTKVDPRFLLYLWLSPDFQRTIASRAVHGSTVDRILLTELSEYPVEVPDLPEQQRIAHILGTLDDKIELNRRMNQTLEAIARAIFKSWFVDFDPIHAKAEGREPVGMDPETATLFPDSFQESALGKIPKEWGTSQLADHITLALGGDWGKPEPDGTFTEPVYCIRGTDLPALGQGDIADLRLRYLKPSSLRKRALEPDDLVFEVSGGSPTQSTGRSLIVNKALRSSYEYPLVCTNFCRLVRFNSPEIGLFIAMLLDRLYSLGEFFQHETGTTTIKNFAFAKFVQNHQIVLPDERVMSAFSRLVKSLLGARDQNGVESFSLSFTRDTLLPRLLSGEIEVPAEEGEPE